MNSALSCSAAAQKKIPMIAWMSEPACACLYQGMPKPDAGIFVFPPGRRPKIDEPFFAIINTLLLASDFLLCSRVKDTSIRQKNK